MATKGNRDNEVYFKPSDKANNTELLTEFVRLHISKSTCKNCQWTFAIVGYKHIDILKTYEKPCLVILHLDLIFVQQLVNVLPQKFNMVEDGQYKPKALDLMGALLIYCEQDIK